MNSIESLDSNNDLDKLVIVNISLIDLKYDANPYFLSKSDYIII